MFLSDWYKGLTPDEQESLEKTLKSNRLLSQRLEAVIKNKIEETSRIATNDYDSPSWAYKAADREGFIRALNYVLLLTKENPISKKE